MDSALSEPITFLPGDRVSWAVSGPTNRVRTGTVIAVAPTPDGDLAKVEEDAPADDFKHRTHVTNVECARLALIPNGRDAERDQAFQALRDIHAEMIRCRSMGDEWASEFLAETWAGLVPAGLRALLDIGPDETDDTD
jgi:hypothetical protein